MGPEQSLVIVTCRDVAHQVEVLRRLAPLPEIYLVTQEAPMGTVSPEEERELTDWLREMVAFA